MKKQILSLVITGSLFFAYDATAQQIKIRNVQNAMETTPPKIVSAKSDIDLAFKNPETANDVNMWCWRGIVYAHIVNSNDSEIIKMAPDAGVISAEAFNNYYQFPKDVRKKTAEYADMYFPIAAIYCFNQAATLAQQSGDYATIKKYLGYVETMINNDEAGTLKNNNLTMPKVYNILVSAAQAQGLESEEILYLNKMADFPQYNNAYVFTRLSEIYASKKEFDKALAIIAKGREKIPQQSSLFLQAEISIETDSSRNNTQGLLNKLTEGINEDPSNAVYYYNRGTVYYTLKKKEVDAGTKPFKYFFSQALNDLRKSLELDPSFMDAMYNEAVTMMDSAEYLYNLRTTETSRYDELDRQSKALYKAALDKLELIRQSNTIKDAALVNLLDNMRKICAKIGDDEGKKRYKQMYIEEKDRYNKSIGQ